jgi:hypothetical protein
MLNQVQHDDLCCEKLDINEDELDSFLSATQSQPHHLVSIFWQLHSNCLAA